MKLLTIITALFLVLTIQTYGQDNATSTPEYEATRQTEKLQQELNLTSDQVKIIYEINLRYARARQNSSTRSEAIQRVKNKDADIEKVLSENQINKLRTKRYERSVYQPNQSESFRSTESTPRVNPSTYRSSGIEMRTRQAEPRRTQTQPSTETRRATPPASTNRNQYSSPSRNENSGNTRNTQTQPSAPARREQSTAPAQRSESSSQVPTGSTETRRR